MCVRRSSGYWPCSTFRVPFPFSRSRTTPRSLRVFAFRERGESIQKGKNGTSFSFLLLHAVFRLPDFATGHSSIALLPFLVCLHSTILSFHGPDLYSCYYLSFFLFFLFGVLHLIELYLNVSLDIR